MRASRSDATRAAPALVYHAGGLGDFVLSLPAILRVREPWAECHWFYWGPSERLNLLPGFSPAPAEVQRAGHTLWGECPAPPVAQFLARCRVLLAFGGRHPPAWGGAAAQHNVALSSFPPPQGLWVPHHQARQLDALGAPPVRHPLIGEWRRRTLAKRAATHLVLHPGSGDEKKNLPIATWLAVASVLRRETGRRVGAVVGPVEAERGNWQAIASGVDEVWECSQLSDLLGVLGRASLLLGNDSGVAHLAGLLGIPTVVIYGPSDPAVWRPLGPRVRVIAADCPRAPCLDGRSIACAQPMCLQEISAEEIVVAARELLEPSATREP